MPAQMTARQRAAFVALAAAFGGKVTFGGKVAEPVEKVASPHKGHGYGEGTGIFVGEVTTAMFYDMTPAQKANAKAKGLGGKCHDCGKTWATNNSNKGGPRTHTC
jgi:hypothetical protein